MIKTFSCGFVVTCDKGHYHTYSMHPLVKAIPDYSLLLALEPEELAGKLLFAGPGDTLNNFLNGLWQERRGVAPEEHSYPQNQRPQIDLAIAEAWTWLEAQGLLVPQPNSFGPGAFRTLSRRAQKIKSDSDFASFRVTRLLPKEVLHHKIADVVWGAFVRGEFDGAAFHAMKAVEVSVRDASQLGNSEIGTDLMQTAFSVDTGPLTDMKVEKSERLARMRLFSGAIGSYKNPHSHRDVNLDDPHEALEIIYLANHLLRIVDARAKARTQVP